MKAIPGSWRSCWIYYPADRVQYDDEGKKAWWDKYQLAVFEDGTTSLDEANDLLGQCVPEPETDPLLLDIIREELAVYFNETDRSARNTAEVIDNRIQLYLDEG